VRKRGEGRSFRDNLHLRKEGGQSGANDFCCKVEMADRSMSCFYAEVKLFFCMCKFELTTNSGQERNYEFES
jgi:hypothetical protein